jgi:hypothetical protein
MNHNSHINIVHLVLHLQEGHGSYFPIHILSRRYPPIQWLPGPLSPGVKWLRREYDHSPPFTAEVRMYGTILPHPQYAFMAWIGTNGGSL